MGTTYSNRAVAHLPIRMLHRSVTIFSGHKFKVPQHIQRIDTSSTHGWQVRYGAEPTEFFSDGTPDGSGAEAALGRAAMALLKRIRRLPAPTGLRTKRTEAKTSNLPVGISGPCERFRPGKASYFTYQVSIPLPGQRSTTRQVYIGTANTITAKRKREALAKAIQVRQAAVQHYEAEATKARRGALAMVKSAA